MSQALCLMRRRYRLHFADEETKTSEMTSLVAITTVKRKIRPGTGQWHEETPTAKVKCQMLILRAAGRAVEGDLLHEDLSQPVFPERVGLAGETCGDRLGVGRALGGE